MTDGADTCSVNHATDRHDLQDITQANERTSQLCANIKEKDIKFYTVAFDVSDTSIKKLMRGCASSPADFFDEENNDELQTAFKNIGATLSPIRIAR